METNPFLKPEWTLGVDVCIVNVDGAWYVDSPSRELDPEGGYVTCRRGPVPPALVVPLAREVVQSHAAMYRQALKNVARGLGY